TRTEMFHNISLKVHSGEIVGLAGLIGAGRSELGRAIYGLYRIDRGAMRLCGKPWSPSSSAEALRAGLVYFPEERKRQGLVLDHSLSDAISIGFTDLIQRWGLLRQSEENNRVRRAIQTFGIRATSPAQQVGTLSGGNQQKTILTRWLDREPSVIILDEPTRGV